ncbi:hypothetical protein [uncultured Ramlibacter sp.]|uniref:hypothetical protein n=1 Tax=uncultured Ramlibacter sp. TaxID=260755 RepID=UPI00260981C6|nr:hypothetical protein [uncultured Ramlibacter sp.]
MAAQHTPAPWRVEADSLVAGDPAGFSIVGGCGCCGSPRINGEGEGVDQANALLIAAAPDLLAALQIVIEQCHREGCDAPVEVVAAIAKATGSANPHPSGSMREGWQRGYEGRPMLAAKGSDYARAYADGQRAKATGAAA